MPATEVLVVDPSAPDVRRIARAAACLRAGGLVAFPTETVYGLGAHALDPVAVGRIFTAKGRPASDPLIVHVASLAALAPLISRMPESVVPLARRFWPGPLTMVLPRHAIVPDAVTAGLGSVAVRVPAHSIARALLIEAGIPVAAPSANLFSRPSPTLASHVLDDLDGRIDMILDGGSTDVGVESTVIDLTGNIAVVLRPGAVSVEALREVLGEVEVRETAQQAETGMPMTSPGLLSKHYSPRAPLTLYEGPPHAALDRLHADARAAEAEGRTVGVLDFGGGQAPGTIAARLYGALRDLDDERPDLILVRGCDTDEGLGRAIQDRLRRAAAGRVIRA